MLDVRLFQNLRFSAASGSVTVASFTLFGFIFMITIYFQFLHGLQPLSTGLRTLPVALEHGAARSAEYSSRSVSATRPWLAPA